MIEDHLGAFAALFLFAIGAVYWIWTAIKLGSLGMLILGVAGPTVICTAPIGLYMLLFGAPDWMLQTFSGSGSAPLFRLPFPFRHRPWWRRRRDAL